MIRTCLEFLLSRRYDNNPGDNNPGDNSPGDNNPGDNQPGDNSQGDNTERDDVQLDPPGRLAPWLQRRLQRDAQLRQFDTEASQLDSVLRSSAAEHRRAMQAESRITLSGMTNSGVPEPSVPEPSMPEASPAAAGASAKDAKARFFNAGDANIRGASTIDPTTIEAATRDAAGSREVLFTLPPRPRDAPTGAWAKTGARAKTSGISAAWLTNLAAAAVLLLVVAPSWSPSWWRPNTADVHAGEFSQQLTVVPGEVLRWLTRAAETSQTQLPQLSPLANLSLPTLPAWEDVALHVEPSMFQEPLLREIDTWQENWRIFKSHLPDSSLEL